MVVVDGVLECLLQPFSSFSNVHKLQLWPSMAANGGFRVIYRGFGRGVAWEAEENDVNRVGYDFLGFIKIFCELGLVA